MLNLPKRRPSTLIYSELLGSDVHEGPQKQSVYGKSELHLNHLVDLCRQHLFQLLFY